MAQASGKQKQAFRAQANKKRKVRQVVWIGGDDDLADQYEAASQRRRRQENQIAVRGSDASDADRLLLEQLITAEEKAKEALQETCIKFVFEPIGSKRLDKLRLEHAPTEAQMTEAAREGVQINFNPDTFPAALIDVCAVEPAHEAGEIEKELLEDEDGTWNKAEIGDLFGAALSVNQDRRRHDLGKG